MREPNSWILSSSSPTVIPPRGGPTTNQTPSSSSFQASRGPIFHQSLPNNKGNNNNTTPSLSSKKIQTSRQSIAVSPPSLFDDNKENQKEDPTLPKVTPRQGETTMVDDWIGFESGPGGRLSSGGSRPLPSRRRSSYGKDGNNNGSTPTTSGSSGRSIPTTKRLFLSPPDFRHGSDTTQVAESTKKTSEEADQNDEARTKPLASSTSTASSSFQSGKAFWMNLMTTEDDHDNDVEEAQDTPSSGVTGRSEDSDSHIIPGRGNDSAIVFTPIGRIIQKTWTSGSPLSDASAYEIDNVDQMWQHHIREIYAELEQVSASSPECGTADDNGRKGTPSTTTDALTVNLNPAAPEPLVTTKSKPTAKPLEINVMPNVQQTRSLFEGHPKQAVAPQPWLNKDRPLSTERENTMSLPEVHEQHPVEYIFSPSSTVSSMTIEQHTKKDNLLTTKRSDDNHQVPAKPLPQFQWARKSLGFDKQVPYPAESKIVPSKLDGIEKGEKVKSKPQPEWARKSLNVVKQQPSTSATSNRASMTTAVPLKVVDQKKTAQNLNLVTNEQEDTNMTEYCLETPKNQSTEPENGMSQFAWARKSLNFSSQAQKVTKAETAPPKVRLTSKFTSSKENQVAETTNGPQLGLKPANSKENRSAETTNGPQLALKPTSSEENDSTKNTNGLRVALKPTSSKEHDSTESTDADAQAGQGFKNLLKAWKSVDLEKSPLPKFLSPEATATRKKSLAIAATTSKLPTPVSACPSTSTVRSSDNGDDKDGEQMRIERMVASFQGNSLRQKPENSVLAMRQKLANRYVDSDFYETTFAGSGEADRAVVILKNNDTFEIVIGDSNPKGTAKLADELKFRSIELVHSNHIDIGSDTCECSGSVFSGNDDLISFFLPQMGMACTCGKRSPSGFVNPDSPTALENVLRPWQVEFLETFGIARCDQLVKARGLCSHILASGLKRWRRKQGMTRFRTSSCSMAIDIWSKTAKIYARSIRKQIDAGHALLDSHPEEVMKQLAQFIGELPASPKRRGEIALFEIDPESEMEV